MIDRVRGWIAAAGLAVLVAGAGCSSCSQKPSESECRAAIENMRKIRGLDHSTADVQMNKAIRSCRGSSSKATAKCLAGAKTEDDLVKCAGEEGQKYVDEENEAERKRQEKVREQGDDSAPDKDKEKEKGQDGE